MADDITQATRNCLSCKQDYPDFEFQSVKDPAKSTGQCTSCRARQKARVVESLAVIAALRTIALGLSPRKATKRTDSLADMTPPRRTAPMDSSIIASQPPATPAFPW